MNGNNRKLNLIQTIALLVSGMIGSAIFSLSGLTISYAGPLSILSWIFAAIIQLFYGLSMAELATTYKKSGGVFIFPESSFDGEKGRRLGFMSAWGNFMADVVSVAFSSTYIAIYLSASFPTISKYQIPISIITIIICLLLNSIRFSTTGKINMILAIILAAILIFFSFIAIRNETFSIGNLIPYYGYGKNINLGLFKAIPVAMIGYSSVMSISFMVSEIDNADKNIKRAVYIGMSVVVLLYIVVIFAVVGNITSKELVDTDMVFIPLFAVCFQKLINFPYMKILISIAAVVALFTTMLVVMAINGRCMKAIADKKLLPGIFSKVNKADTPILSMMVLSIASIILSLFPSITETLVNLGALFAIITIVINLLSLIETRRKKRQSSFHSPLSNVGVIVIIAIFIICYIPDILSGGLNLWAFTMIWYLIGIVVYNVKSKSKA